MLNTDTKSLRILGDAVQAHEHITTDPGTRLTVEGDHVGVLVVVQKVTVVLEQCLVAHQNVVQFADAVSVIFRNRDKPLAQTCLIAKRGRNVGGQEGDHGSVKVEAWGK